MSSLGAIRPLGIGSCRCHLTPLLTPLRAQYAESVCNPEQGNQLIYADSATLCNIRKQVSADCGSEGRGFESRRSPFYLQAKPLRQSNKVADGTTGVPS